MFRSPTLAPLANVNVPDPTSMNRLEWRLIPVVYSLNVHALHGHAIDVAREDGPVESPDRHVPQRRPVAADVERGGQRVIGLPKLPGTIGLLPVGRDCQPADCRVRTKRQDPVDDGRGRGTDPDVVGLKSVSRDDGRRARRPRHLTSNEQSGTRVDDARVRVDGEAESIEGVDLGGIRKEQDSRLRRCLGRSEWRFGRRWCRSRRGRRPRPRH